MPVYLIESYLLHLTRGYYKCWRGSTLEESPGVEYRRNLNQWLCMVNGEYSLPIDFANFDHQIAKSEILLFTDISRQCVCHNMGTD